MLRFWVIHFKLTKSNKLQIFLFTATRMHFMSHVSSRLLLCIVLYFCVTSHVVSSNVNISNGAIKLLDFDNETRNGAAFVNAIRIKEHVIFISRGGPSNAYEVWSQSLNEDSITKIFGDKNVSAAKNRTFRFLDDNKLLFYVGDVNHWYVTDGTKTGTRPFTELDVLLNELSFEGAVDTGLTFVGTNDNGSLSIIFEYAAYNVSLDTKTVEVVKDRIEFTHTDIRAVVGNTIFHDRFDKLMAVNQLTLEETQLIDDTNSNQDISFHDPRFSDPSIGKFNGDQRYNKIKLMSNSPIIKEGFVNFKEGNSFSLIWIRRSGEIVPIPIFSDVPFVSPNIVNDGQTMFAQIFQSGQTTIVKIDLTTFDFTVLDIPLMPGSRCNDYYGFEPLYLNENGLLLAALSECSNQQFKQLIYLHNDGEIYYVSDENGALDAQLELISVSDSNLIFSATYKSEEQFWAFSLNDLILYRVPKTGTEGRSIRYTFNDNYYQEFLLPVGLNSEMSIVKQLEFSKGIYNPIHVFDKAITSSVIPANVVETSSGIVMLAKPNITTAIDILWTLRLSKNNELETISKIEKDRRNVVFFGHPKMDKIVLLDLGQTDEQDFTLFDPLTGSESATFELPALDDGSFFEKILDYQNNKLLIQYTSAANRGFAFNYGLLDLDDLSLDFFRTASDVGFLNAQFCADKIVYIDEQQIYVASSTDEPMVYDFSTITNTNFINDNVLAIITYDEATRSKHIYSYNCQNNELTQHLQFSYADQFYAHTDILAGVNGRFLISGSSSDNVRINTESGGIDTYPNTNNLMVGQISANLVDTEFGLYAFVRGKGDIPEDVRLYQTFVFKEQNGSFVQVNQFMGDFIRFESSQYDPSHRIFNMGTNSTNSSTIEDNQLNGGDLTYFAPESNTFGFIDIQPGKERTTFITPFFSSDGKLVLSTKGRFGADIYSINLTCSDLNNIDTCTVPFENSPPELFGPTQYDFALGQSIYIPIRAIDEDDDKITVDASGLLEWLVIEDDVLKGKVPSDFAPDSFNVSITAKDELNETDVIDLTFTKVSVPLYKNSAVKLEQTTQEPPTVINPPINNLPTTSESGGTLNLWLLALLFIVLQQRTKETIF